MNKFVCVKCSEVWESKEPSRDGVCCDKCKDNKEVMKSESTYLWLDVLKNQLTADVADDRMINAVDHAQVIIREKVTGYADERTNHIKSACGNKTTVTELPERYRGIDISDTVSRIRHEIIMCDIDYLKDLTLEQMELLVQLFEKEKTKKA